MIYTLLFPEVLFSEFNMMFLSFVMFIVVIDGLNISLINKTENIAFSFAVNENTRFLV
jgi:hypothetical protein